MKHFRKLMKVLLVTVLSVMLAFTMLSVNTNEVNAAYENGYEYRMEIARGLGHIKGSSSVSEFFNATDNSNGYSWVGYNNGVTAASTKGGATNRYTQNNNGVNFVTANKVSGIDVYYGDQVLKNQSVTNLYYTSGGQLTTTGTGNTQLYAYSSSTVFYLRFVNIYNDFVAVLHYFNEHTVTVNGVEDAGFANTFDDNFDKYFTTKDLENQTVSTIVSNDYTNASGLAEDFTLDSEGTLGGVSVSVGSNPASTSVTSGVQYLASDYTFSSEHDASDILAIDFENNQILYYAVNTDIVITFNYATEVTHEVTFKVGEDVYDSEEVYEGFTVNQPANPTIPEGYNSFKGWYVEGTDEAYDFSSPVNADLVLYAQFANVRSFTFKNVKSVSASQWVSTFGGTGFTGSNGTYVAYTGDDIINEEETGSNGLMIRFDYNHAITRAIVKVGEVESELPQEYFETTDEYFLDSEGNWSDEMGDPTENTYIMKLATLGNNDYAFLRVWNVTEDIEIEVELEEHKVTFVNFGHKYPSSAGTFLSTPYVAFTGDTWTSETGGTLYASPKAAIDEFDVGENANKGNHHQAVAVTNGDYYEDPTVSSTGVGGSLMTSIADLESIVFTFGENEPIELVTNGDEIRGKTYFINSSYELEQRTAAQEGDLFKLAVNSNDTYTIYIRFYDISEDITIEAKYFVEHTIRILNFGNEGHNYIGTGAYSTNTSGNYVGVRCWDPYGTGSGNNKRNGGTIDYAAGVATIYGDYSSTSGIGAALLVHENYELHDKVRITYGEETVEYDLDNENGVNQNWYIGETKILQFVQNKNVEYYNVRFFNVAGDITIESLDKVVADVGAVTAELTLNNDGTLTEKINPILPNYDENYVATIDGEEVELSLVDEEAGKYSISTPAKAPKNLSDPFVVQISNGEEVIYEYTTSMKDYMYALLASPTFAPLAKSMINYASYAQSYFGHMKDELANANLEEEDKDVSNVTYETVAGYAASRAGETEGISAYGQSLVLKNAVHLRVYFMLDGTHEISEYKFYDGDESLRAIHYSGNLYYVEVSNTAAPDLDVEHTISAKLGEEGGLTVTCSPLTYAEIVLRDAPANDKEAKLANLVRSMYNYAVAAKALLSE